MSYYSMCHFILVLFVISCLLCLNTSSSMSSKPLLVVFVVSLNIKRNWITSWKLQLTFSRTQMHHQVLLNRTINDKVTKCYAKLAVVYLIELPNNSTNQDDMFALKMSILFIISDSLNALLHRVTLINATLNKQIKINHFSLETHLHKHLYKAF